MDRIIDINICGNHIKKGNNNAGVRGEGNVTLLRISFDESWDDYAKTVTFWDARGANPVERILTTDYLESIEDSTRLYIIPIPEEPLAIAGKLTFVIDGYVVGKRKRSLSDTLIVEDAPITDDAGEPVDPTPTQAEQLQAEIEKIKGDIQQVAGAKETTTKNAEDAEGYANTAQESAESAEAAADKAVTAISHNPVIVDGYWHIWSTQDESYISTGIKAQAGSNVYLGDNPPEYADVWIDPDGELEGRTLTVGANGNITVDEFVELLNPKAENPYQYDNVRLLEDIVVNRAFGNCVIRFNSLDLNGKTLTMEDCDSVDIYVNSTKNGKCIFRETISGYMCGVSWIGGEVRDVEVVGDCNVACTDGNFDNVKLDCDGYYAGTSTFKNCQLKTLMWFGGSKAVITVINTEIGYCDMTNKTTAVLIQNKIGVICLNGYNGNMIPDGAVIPDGSLENKILIGNTIEEYATPELKSIELAKESYVNDKLLDLANKVAPSPASVTLYADRWEQTEDETRWHQEVVVANATITPYSKVDLQLSSEQIMIFYEKDLAFVTENEDGVVAVYCIGRVPENDYVIQATVSEVVVDG